MLDVSWEGGVSCVCDAICCSHQGLEQREQLLVVPPVRSVKLLKDRSNKIASCKVSDNLPDLLASDLSAVLGGHKRH